MADTFRNARMIALARNDKANFAKQPDPPPPPVYKDTAEAAQVQPVPPVNEPVPFTARGR